MTDPDHELDKVDRALLRRLQQDCRQSHEALGEQLHLSPSAVRRRLKRLREAGVITAEVAVLNAPRLGIGVIIGVRMEKESEHTYQQFKRRMAQAPEIQQCYSVSGSVDFILIGHFRDLPDYESWMRASLLSDPAIARSDAHFIYDCVKRGLAIPV